MAAKIKPPDFAPPGVVASSTARGRRSAGRVFGDAGQDVSQPGLRVDVVQFGGDD
jgi:hypothetical protein